MLAVHNHAAQVALTTIVVALSAGVLLIAVARRMGVPAIVLLLTGGVLLGPEVLGIVVPSTLGGGMRVLVSLLVGIILFEGGLTLEIEGYRRAPRVIVRMLTVGVLVTWLSAATAMYVLTEFRFTFCLVAASLVIVTGPTVIGPLLKRIRVNEKLHHILHWEGVLIDPIGVFLAILCFEALALDRGASALLDLVVRVGAGLGVGAVGGLVLKTVLGRRWLPDDMSGVGTLALAVLIFGGAEILSPEAGLLAVTVAGLVVGISRPAGLASIRHFKAEVTELSIGILFILLSARLELAQFKSFGLGGVLVIAAMIVVVRPLAIAIATWGITDLSRSERAFLSWVAPRGIVAASMASLFALEFERLGVYRPRFVESFTYGVIVATILLQATTAGALARILGLGRGRARGWLIVGAHSFGRAVARYLIDRGQPVLLVDANRRYVRAAITQKLPALVSDAMDVERIQRRPEMGQIGQLLALTANEELNSAICRRYREVFDDENCFRWRRAIVGDARDTSAGQPIWTGLASPSVIAGELDKGDAHLREAPSPHGLARPRHRLFTGEADSLVPNASAELQNRSLKSLEPGLVLERGASRFVRALRDELVVELGTGTPESVLREMIERAHHVLTSSSQGSAPRLRLDVDALHEDVVGRERAMPTILGAGIAVPHAFVTGLESQVCVVGRRDTAGDWFDEAAGSEAVSLVILLLSPVGDHEGHLAILADMARMLSDDNLRRRLFEVDAAAIPQVLRQAHV